MRELATTDAVVLALGGNRAVAEILGASGASIEDRAKRVSDWRHREPRRFPPDTFLILQDALRTIGKTAPPALWGIEEPAAKKRRAAA